MQNKYYVDSCIYINLFKKEISFHGNSFYNSALKFFEDVEKNNTQIYFSGFILKELRFILESNLFNKARLFLYNNNFKRIIATDKDYYDARKFEILAKFNIGFFDCMHIVLSQKVNATLVTRDRKLIDFAKNYCKVARPEEL